LEFLSETGVKISVCQDYFYTFVCRRSSLVGHSQKRALAKHTTGVVVTSPYYLDDPALHPRLISSGRGISSSAPEGWYRECLRDAFWCLVQICELYVPGYYSQGLEAVQLDGQVLFSLLKKVSAVAYKHLKKHQVDPLLYMTEWFMCLFSRTLPWATVLRVWDMFFSEGVKVIFRVALVLLKVSLGSSDKLKDCQGLVETLEKLRNIPPRFLQENFIIHEV
ncbi:TBC1 domain family member 10A-like, partial [Cetorhinus maximus]